MKHSKKVLSLLLLAALLLAGCGETGKESESSSGTDTNTVTPDVSGNDTAVSEEEVFKDNVPERNYNGETFTFLTQPNDGNGYWGHFEFYAEETKAIPVNDAVYDRNKLIEERFNIMIDENCTTAWLTNFRTTIAAQEDAYDCVPLNIQTAAAEAINGNLLNFSFLEHIDLDQPWWDPVLNDISTIANQQYFAIGDITLLDKEATYIMMFNKDVSKNHQVENLYTLVEEGTWTMDKLMDICAQITNDLDGNGEYTFDDMVGMVTDDGATLEAMYYTCGGTFFAKNTEDMPEYSIDMDRSARIIEKIQKIYNSDDVMLAATLMKQGISNPWSDEGINGMFKQGRALFYGISLTVMNKMRDMDSDFGVIPYPKLDETDAEYTSFVYNRADTISVPITCSDAERTSAILEAMCCESSNIVMPAYYDVTITNKTARDEKSKEMLDYIFDHRTLDPVQLFDWGGMNTMLYSIKSADTFASSVKKLERIATRAMEKTYASMNAPTE